MPVSSGSRAVVPVSLRPGVTSTGSWTSARARSSARRLVHEIGEIPDFLGRRRADALPAVEFPTASVVLTARLAVPELPRGLGIDCGNEEAEQCDARCVDLVTCEDADSDDEQEEGDKRAGRLADPQHVPSMRCVD